MIKFFWMPIQVWYYVVIPIIIILLSYFFFTIVYRKKKGTLYYDYVVDYVYSTLGILFCSLLLCLLIGYSTATLQIIFKTGLFQNYLFLVIVLIILPIVPFIFLIYVIRIYLRNVKKKSQLDHERDLLAQKETEVSNSNFMVNQEKFVNHESIDNQESINNQESFIEPELKKIK